MTTKKIMHFILVGLTVGSSLTSCGLYKPYESSFTLPGEPAPQWKEVFTDPCLQTLIDSTLKNNREEKVALLNIQQAQAACKAAAMGYLPTVALGGSNGALTGGFSKYGSAAATGNYDLGITASWQLDVFGASITHTKRQSQASLDYQEYYKQAVDCQLVSSMAQLYYQLLAQEKQLQIQQDMLALYEKTCESTQSLFQAGQYTSVAVDESRAQLENLRAGILDLKYSIENTRKGICQLMDVKPYDFTYGTLDQVPVPALATDGVPADRLGARPDLLAAEKQVEIAFYDVQLSRGAFYPGLNITAGGGWTNPATWFANLLGSLTQPVFQGGKLTAKLRTARLAQEIAVTNLERKMLDAYYEVVNALDGCKLATDKQAPLHAQVEALQGSVSANQELMNNGQATYLEVLTSMQNYLTARTAEVSNQASAAQSLITLYAALGGR